MHSRGSESGQASVELIAVLPTLLLCALVAIELVIAGYAIWSSAGAARAGARAAHVGGDAEAAARSALPVELRRDASVHEGDGEVAVAVRVPGMLPGASGPAVRVRAALDPEGAGG